MLAPTLVRGDIAVMNNLHSHKRSTECRVIRAVGPRIVHHAHGVDGGLCKFLIVQGAGVYDNVAAGAWTGATKPRPRC